MAKKKDPKHAREDYSLICEKMFIWGPLELQSAID